MRAFLRVPSGSSSHFPWVISSTPVTLRTDIIVKVQLFLQTYKMIHLPTGHLHLGILQTPQTQYVQHWTHSPLTCTPYYSPISANGHYHPSGQATKWCHPWFLHHLWPLQPTNHLVLKHIPSLSTSISFHCHLLNFIYHHLSTEAVCNCFLTDILPLALFASKLVCTLQPESFF